MSNSTTSVELMRATAIEAMNHGFEFAQRQTREAGGIAIGHYSEAIALLRPIADNERNANSLGAALMNRGRLRHQINGIQNSVQAEQDYEEAILVLHPYFDQTERSTWTRRNYLGTLINHANLLLDTQNANQARAKAKAAIAFTHITRQSELVDFQLFVQARRCYCDAAGLLLPTQSSIEQTETAKFAKHFACEGLEAVRQLRRHSDSEPFPEISERLFRYGARLIANFEPSKLRDYLDQHLSGLVDAETLPSFTTIAHEAIESAVDYLSKSVLDPETDCDTQDQLPIIAQSLFEYAKGLRAHL